MGRIGKNVILFKVMELRSCRSTSPEDESRRSPHFSSEMRVEKIAKRFIYQIQSPNVTQMLCNAAADLNDMTVSTLNDMTVVRLVEEFETMRAEVLDLTEFARSLQKTTETQIAMTHVFM